MDIKGVIKPTGTQRRFADYVLFPTRRKLVENKFERDGKGAWVMFDISRLNKLGRRMGMEYEFASNGKVVVQCVGYNILTDEIAQEKKWRSRGGISQEDISFMVAIAKQYLAAHDENPEINIDSIYGEPKL